MGGPNWEANLSGWQVLQLENIVSEVGSLEDPDEGRAVHIQAKKMKAVSFRRHGKIHFLKYSFQFTNYAANSNWNTMHEEWQWLRK